MDKSFSLLTSLKKKEKKKSTKLTNAPFISLKTTPLKIRGV